MSGVVIQSGFRLYHERMSAPDVLRFLKSQNETGTLVGALVIVDQERGLALLATRSITRGAAFVQTGWSDHYLLLPVGRWRMLASSVGFEIVDVVDHLDTTLPVIPNKALQTALQKVAGRHPKLK
ncbi:hypothetical protein [Geopseudomonas aromaticivorans]